MSRRSYKGSSVSTTLSAAISSSDTVATVTDGTSLPDGATAPFVLTFGLEQAGEEKVLCTSRSGNTLSGLSRGWDGTAATAHNAGERVDHTISAVDMDEANAHINASANAHPASAIVNTPAGTISATTVQAALNELDTEKISSAQGDLLYAPFGSGAASPLVLTSTATGQKPLVVKGFAGQTANLLEAENNGSTPLAWIRADGGIVSKTGLYAGPSLLNFGVLGVEGITASAIVAEIRAASGQSTDIVTISDTFGAPLSGFAKDGAWKAGAALSTTGANSGTASALPGTPAGYVTVNIAGTNRKIAYYAL